MRSTFQIHGDKDFGSVRKNSEIDFPIEAAETHMVKHSFSRDILKVDRQPTQTSSTHPENTTFSDVLYQELLNKGMGSKENFERVFHLQ